MSSVKRPVRSKRTPLRSQTEEELLIDSIIADAVSGQSQSIDADSLTDTNVAKSYEISIDEINSIDEENEFGIQYENPTDIKSTGVSTTPTKTEAADESPSDNTRNSSLRSFNVDKCKSEYSEEYKVYTSDDTIRHHVHVYDSKVKFDINITGIVLKENVSYDVNVFVNLPTATFFLAALGYKPEDVAFPGDLFQNILSDDQNISFSHPDWHTYGEPTTTHVSVVSDDLSVNDRSVKDHSVKTRSAAKNKKQMKTNTKKPKEELEDPDFEPPKSPMWGGEDDDWRNEYSPPPVIIEDHAVSSQDSGNTMDTENPVTPVIAISSTLTPLINKKRLKLTCKECGYVGSSAARLKRHQLAHEKVRAKPFKCELCPMAYKSKVSLRAHMKTGTHGVKDLTPKASAVDLVVAIPPTEIITTPRVDPDTGLLAHVCDICGHRARNTMRLQLHIRSHAKNAVKKYKCTKCDAGFSRNSGLARHMKEGRHKGLRRQMNIVRKCDQCPYVGADNSALKRHKRKHTGEKAFSCHICGGQFTKSSHMLVHTKEKRHKCDICAATFVWKLSLRNHISSVHEGKRTYHCKECPASFFSASTLSTHRYVHSNVREFICRVCEKSFFTKDMLRRHEMQHTGVKPFKCDKCTYSTYTAADLKKHSTVHSDERPWTCQVCGYGSKTERYFKVHMKSHGGEEDRNHRCHLCSYSTYRSSMLKKHIKTHVEKPPKPYPCPQMPYCQFASISAKTLKRHLKAKHNIDFSLFETKRRKKVKKEVKVE